MGSPTNTISTNPIATSLDKVAKSSQQTWGFTKLSFTRLLKCYRVSPTYVISANMVPTYAIDKAAVGGQKSQNCVNVVCEVLYLHQFLTSDLNTLGVGSLKLQTRRMVFKSLHLHFIVQGVPH